MFKQFKNHLVGSVPDFGRFETLDMDSVLKAVFRIRIQGLKTRSKMLNQNKIISLFTTLYLSIAFCC